MSVSSHFIGVGNIDSVLFVLCLKTRCWWNGHIGNLKHFCCGLILLNYSCYAACFGDHYHGNHFHLRVVHEWGQLSCRVQNRWTNLYTTTGIDGNKTQTTTTSPRYSKSSTNWLGKGIIINQITMTFQWIISKSQKLTPTFFLPAILNNDVLNRLVWLSWPMLLSGSSLGERSFTKIYTPRLLRLLMVNCKGMDFFLHLLCDGQWTLQSSLASHFSVASVSLLVMIKASWRGRIH